MSLQTRLAALITAIGTDIKDLKDNPEILSGNGVPSNALGKTGDWYFDLVPGLLYGPKQAFAPNWPPPSRVLDKFWSDDFQTDKLAQYTAVSGNPAVAAGYLTLASGTDAVVGLPIQMRNGRTVIKLRWTGSVNGSCWIAPKLIRYAAGNHSFIYCLVDITNFGIARLVSGGFAWLNGPIAFVPTLNTDYWMETYWVGENYFHNLYTSDPDSVLGDVTPLLTSQATSAGQRSGLAPGRLSRPVVQITNNCKIDSIYAEPA